MSEREDNFGDIALALEKLAETFAKHDLPCPRMLGFDNITDAINFEAAAKCYEGEQHVVYFDGRWAEVLGGLEVVGFQFRLTG